MMVPAREVLAVIQHSLCLVGNASEGISQTRRTKILEAINKSWGKYGADKFKSSDTLFGKEFQSSLTDRVEKDVALSKAVSIMKRSQQGKEQSGSSSRRKRTGNKCGLKSSRERGASAGRGATAVLPTQLGVDLQRPMDLGNDIRVQTGVFRLPLSEKGTNTGTFERGEGPALDGELEKMAMKQAIELVRDSSQATFVSPMFVVTKADGCWRPVINLKCLNQHILARHFKMESIKTAKGLLCREDWMIKLDLKDAYLLVPLYHHHRKFLAFHWRGQLWRFTSLPFGLSSAPFIFTKLMKPIVATLRKLGIRVILYLDDILVMAPTKEEVRKHLATALELLIALGFVINMKKSVTCPDQVTRSS